MGAKNIKLNKNDRFGKLTFIESRGKDKHNKTLCYCECDCGGNITLPKTYLITGKTIDCRQCDATKMGDKFNRLTFVRDEGKNDKNYTMAIFTCQCDDNKAEHIFLKSRVICGTLKSCGCLHFEVSKARMEQINKIATENSTAKERFNAEHEHGCWRSMRKRCYYEEHDSYGNYGGRGITVCDRWNYSFDNFIKDMGYSPTPEHSIDRIDNYGNYEPNNCRWATPEEQARNRRFNLYYTINNERKLLVEWTGHYNIDYQLVWQRIDKGMDPLLALTTPIYEPIIYTINNVSRNVKEWSAHTGLKEDTIYNRLDNGWSVENAILLPVGARPTKP